MSTGQIQTEDYVRPLLVAVTAIVASVVVMLILGSSGKLVPLTLIGGMCFLLLAYLSGNQRLLMLMGLVFSAPNALSLNFMTVVHIGGSMSYSIDLVDFFLVALLMFQIRDIRWGDRNTYVVPTVSGWWFVLIGLGVISFLLGPYRHLSGYETVRMSKNLLFFLVLVNELRRVRQFEYVFLALGASVLFQVGISFLQFMLRRDLGLQALGEGEAGSTAAANLGVYAEASSVYRVGGLMGHPNLLSAYLAMHMPILIALMFTRYSITVKTILGVLLALCSASLLLTLSRSGWISFAGAFLVLLALLFFEGGWRKRHLVLKGFLLIGAFVAALAVSGPVIQRITQSDSGATDFRFEWMVVAMKMIAEKPVLGFGVNRFVYDMVPYTPQASVPALIDRFGEGIPAVHNIYLLVWSEQGTIGFLAFLFFHIHLLRIAYRNLRYRIDDRMHAVNIGAACGVLALMIDGMASFYLRVPACARTFWVVAALIVAINHWNRNNYKLRLGLALAKLGRGAGASGPAGSAALC